MLDKGRDTVIRSEKGDNNLKQDKYNFSGHPILKTLSYCVDRTDSYILIKRKQNYNTKDSLNLKKQDGENKKGMEFTAESQMFIPKESDNLGVVVTYQIWYRIELNMKVSKLLGTIYLMCFKIHIFYIAQCILIKIDYVFKLNQRVLLILKSLSTMCDKYLQNPYIL